MARQDMDIKGDVISELADIVDPRLGVNLLDALMVEDLSVNKGQVTLALIYDKDRPDTERDALQDAIAEILGDIEGVAGVGFEGLSRAQVHFKTLADLGPIQPAPTAPKPPEAPAPAPKGGDGLLSLGQLLAVAEDLAPEAPEEDTGGKLEIYSGGGCAAGTLAQPEVKSSKPSPAPIAAARKTAPKIVVDSAPARVDGASITIPLSDWESLIGDKRALEMQVLSMEERINALQGALRAMIEG